MNLWEYCSWQSLLRPAQPGLPAVWISWNCLNLALLLVLVYSLIGHLFWLAVSVDFGLLWHHFDCELKHVETTLSNTDRLQSISYLWVAFFCSTIQRSLSSGAIEETDVDIEESFHSCHCTWTSSSKFEEMLGVLMEAHLKPKRVL